MLTPGEIKQLAIHINEGSEHGAPVALAMAYRDRAGAFEAASKDSTIQKAGHWIRGSHRPSAAARAILVEMYADMLLEKTAPRQDGMIA